MAEKKRVCIIGAGPCGMSCLYQFEKIADPSVDIVCYEKTHQWAGLWNYTWMTGTDEFGEPCLGGQYRFLWSNGPKECLEYPDYTFEDHFGKPIPSFPPRTVLRDYIEGRFTKKPKTDLKRFIKFNHVIRSVRYNKDSDDFTVIVEDLKTRNVTTERFSHVICATGIFNFPNKPTLDGIDTFPGRIIHSHDFRDAKEYKGQSIFILGASYSAEDISMQCMKFGAKNVVTSYRSKPMGFKFPPGIEEKPLATKIDGNTIHFKDCSSANFDSIILCTGYLYHYPYLNDELRLQSRLTVYPAGVYKGALWLKGGNNKLFYTGIYDQYFSYTMFDVQALWICQFITGKLKGEPKRQEEMNQDEQKWSGRAKALKDCYEDITFQADFIADLCAATGYHPDAPKGEQLFIQWENDKRENIATYRDKQYKSIYTGSLAPKHRPWYTDMDESIEAFIN